MRLWIDDELLIDGCRPARAPTRRLISSLKPTAPTACGLSLSNDGRGARVIFGYSEGREDIEAAVALAREADVAILCLGDNEETSGENFDRVSLDLPGRQLALAKAVWATGTPTVLVLQSGRPVTANWENEHLDAILEAWFPASRAGRPSPTCCSARPRPGGRLPITFPRSVGQVPCHYARRPGGGKKYVEMDWAPLWPFGYGLTYTTFAYQDLRLSADTIPPDGEVEATVTVTNTGAVAGDAVPQLYVRTLSVRLSSRCTRWPALRASPWPPAKAGRCGSGWAPGRCAPSGRITSGGSSPAGLKSRSATTPKTSCSPPR